MCVLTIARNIPSLVCPYKRIDHEFIAGLFPMDILYTPWDMRIARGKYTHRLSGHSSPHNFVNEYTQRHERKHWFCYTCPWGNMSTSRFNHIPLNCWSLGHLGTLHRLTGTCVRNESKNNLSTTQSLHTVHEYLHTTFPVSPA